MLPLFFLVFFAYSLDELSHAILDPIDRDPEECFILDSPPCFIDRNEVYPWEPEASLLFPIDLFQCKGSPHNPERMGQKDCDGHEEAPPLHPILFHALKEWHHKRCERVEVIKGWCCKKHNDYVGGQDPAFLKGEKVFFTIPALPLEEAFSEMKKTCKLNGVFLSIEPLPLADLDCKEERYALSIRCKKEGT